MRYFKIYFIVFKPCFKTLFFFSVIYFSIKTTTPTFITGNKDVLGSFMSHDSVGWLGSVGWFFCSLWFQLESLQQVYSAGAHLELGTSLICPTGLWLHLSPAGWFYFFTCESGTPIRRAKAEASRCLRASSSGKTQNMMIPPHAEV